MTDISLDGIRFRRPGFDLALDAAFQPGVTALMGASGSGKSTVLDLIAGFEAPQAGRIVIGLQDVTALAPHLRPVSVIFQDNNLFGHLDAEANAGLGISPSLKLTQSERSRVRAALAETGLAGKEGRLPSELSGGERQRVALARALVRQRPVLLLDEPFAALGPAMRAEMGELISSMVKARGLTAVLVTHDPEEAARLAKTVVFLAGGTVAASGPATEVLALRAGPVGDYLGRQKA